MISTLNSFVPVRSILVAVEVNDEAALLLRHAIRFANCFRADIQILHVCVSKDPLASRDRLLRILADDIAESQVLRIEEGSVFESIDAIARRADLLIVGAHSRSMLSFLDTSSLAGRLVRARPCAMFVVPIEREPTRDDLR